MTNRHVIFNALRHCIMVGAVTKNSRPPFYRTHKMYAGGRGGGGGGGGGGESHTSICDRLWVKGAFGAITKLEI